MAEAAAAAARIAPVRVIIKGNWLYRQSIIFYSLARLH